MPAAMIAVKRKNVIDRRFYHLLPARLQQTLRNVGGLDERGDRQFVGFLVEQIERQRRRNRVAQRVGLTR